MTTARSAHLVDSPATAPRARAGWSSLVALASGTAVLVASEFLPASVLPTMAADLGISEGTVGLAVAATAVAGAVTAPSIAVLLPRADRRTVLVGLLVAATLAAWPATCWLDGSPATCAWWPRPRPRCWEPASP